MRVLHISDVHVDVPLQEMPISAFWFNKRIVGGSNHMLRRRPRFRRAREKLGLLEPFCEREAIDLVICTGDYTILGTEPELRAAREAIEPLTGRPAGFVTVPGNHDVYLPDSLGLFERYFGSFLKSDLPDYQVDGSWPLVRLFGEHAAVVAVNSARPNPPVFRSSGRIPERQLNAMVEVLKAEALKNRFVFVITHYAPRLADGGPDREHHGLENAEAFLNACRSLARGAILHGHVHRRYRVDAADGVPPQFGAGSTTQRGSEGLWVFDTSDCSATAGEFSDGDYRLLSPLPIA